MLFKIRSSFPPARLMLSEAEASGRSIIFICFYCLMIKCQSYFIKYSSTYSSRHFFFIIIAYQYFEMESQNNESESSSSNLPLDPLASLRSELTAMQFDEHLIEQALKRTNNLEKAIEIIISIMEEGDSQQPKVDCPRLLLLVRMDLKMGVGKVAAQCGHASLRAYQMARSKAFKDEEYSLVFVRWLQSGQQKTVYRVQDEEQLFRVLDRFKAMGVETCYIRDAGRTQISAGTATVGAVGPFSSHKMQAVTKDLSLL